MGRSRSVSVLALALLIGMAVMLVPGVAAAAPDDDYPGVPLPASPAHGALDGRQGPNFDAYDLYSVDLSAGDELQLSLTGGSGTFFGLDLHDQNGQLVAVDYFNAVYPKVLSFLVPEGRAGTYYIGVSDQTAGTSGGGTHGLYTLTWSVNGGKVARLYGADRYATAVAVSRSTFATSANVVLTTGENYADALSASGLAGALGAPMLLTRVDRLPNPVTDEIIRLEPRKVWVIGGTSVVGATVVNDIAHTFVGTHGSVPTVERIAGTDRYATAAAVAAKLSSIAGTDTAFLASGVNYADALALAPLAYRLKAPLLLTRPSALPSASAAALVGVGATHIIVGGGPAAVSAQVVSAADAIAAANAGGGVHDIAQWGGVDRYDTARIVAQNAVWRGWSSFGAVGLVCGTRFPDGLAGSALIGSRGGVMLLTAPSSLTTAASDVIEGNGFSISKVIIFGGSGAVREQVRTTVTQLLE